MKSLVRTTRSVRLTTVLALTLITVLLISTGSAFSNPPAALTNTAVTEAQILALATAPPVMTAYSGTGIFDNLATSGAGDCNGAIQSGAFDIGGGLFLYAYQLECHCGPNWDILNLVVPMSGNAPVGLDINGDSTPDTSWHVTDKTQYLKTGICK